MLNVKLCSIVAGCAFLLSFLAGIIGGADFLTILLRAMISGACFFGFSAGASFLISRFLPELIGESIIQNEEGENESLAADRVGGTVDVSVGGEDDEELIPFAASEEDRVDGILSGPGLDQGQEGGYTGVERSVAPSPEAARPPDLVGDVDVLPDLEGFSDSFVTPINVDGSGDSDEPRRMSSVPSSSGTTGGQFDAKEMAMAIQTILKRDQKG